MYNKILGEKIKITYNDIGSNFSSKITLRVIAIKEGVSHSTTEVKIMLSCAGEDRFPPFILMGKRNNKDITPRVYLPWVKTDNPLDSFVPCILEHDNF